MNLTQFHHRWKRLTLVTESNQEIPLVSLLKECSGEHRGGLMFYTHKGDIWILKCDADNNCERLLKSGTDDEDWYIIGQLVDPRGPDVPYT